MGSVRNAVPRPQGVTSKLRNDAFGSDSFDRSGASGAAEASVPTDATALAPSLLPGDRSRLLAVYPKLRRLAAVLADADMDPDDLVQDVFVQYLAALDADGRVLHPEAYLRRCLVNVVNDHRRRLARDRSRGERLRQVRPVTPPWPGCTDGLAATLGGDTPDGLVGRVLRECRPLDRTLVFLVDVEGYSAKEAAELLGLSHAAARARLSRTRRRIKALVAPQPLVGHEPLGGTR